MNKQAYSRLERDGSGIIRVVFYDAETSLPVDDLTGYTIVALDEQGQAVPVNSSVPSGGTTVPVSSANIPTVSEPAVIEQISQRDGQVTQPRENGGSVSEMDLEPVNGFLGPQGMINEALGNKNADGNTGWRNGLLTSGVGLLASAALGGPAGLAAGVVAKGVVNSDKFKNKFNDRGQLSKFGVGIGEPKAPTGTAPEQPMDGFVPKDYTPSTGPTPVDSYLDPQAQSTQTIGSQRTNIPSSGVSPRRSETASGAPPIDGGYKGTDMRQAPSMSAFNRREPAVGSKGTVESFDRTGLTNDIQNVADRVGEAVPGAGINSGYRSPASNARAGGANRSQHMSGNAIDINTAGWSNEQKRDALEAAVQAGARGIGIYGSGTSLHVDARRTSPAQWGVGGSYAGASIDQMPEWSRDTLKAMHGAGVNGNVGPRIGPTPTARSSVVSDTSKVSSAPSLDAIEQDPAFQSRPDFGSMSIGQVATSGYGKRPSEAQIDAMAYTLAGELDPSAMNNPKAVANLAATLNNRIESVGPKATFTGTQYNSLTPENRAVTNKNYQEFGENLKQSVRDFYNGKNVPDVPDATHYYNPDIANPAWAGNLTDTITEAGHRIGKITGEYTSTEAKTKEARREADDTFTSRSLSSQAGRNVEDKDKQISGDRRTSVGLGSRTKSSPTSSTDSKSSGKGFANSKSMSTRTKDDNVSSKSSSGKGLGSKSSGLNTSNAKSMSTRSKDDSTKSSSKSSSSVDKSVASEKSKDKGEKKSGV